jgi:hypothetical protein
MPDDAANVRTYAPAPEDAAQTPPSVAVRCRKQCERILVDLANDQQFMELLTAHTFCPGTPMHIKPRGSHISANLPDRAIFAKNGNARIRIWIAIRRGGSDPDRICV